MTTSIFLQSGEYHRTKIRNKHISTHDAYHYIDFFLFIID
jgi:hypothetical protein